MTATVRVASPEAIASGGAASPPYLRAPSPQVFALRAMRLTQLAARGGPMAEFLRFNARLAQAQQQALDALPPASASDLAQTPLDVPLDTTWRAALPLVLAALDGTALPDAAKALVERLRLAEPAWLDRQADALRHGLTEGLDLGASSLIAAALQVHLTAQVQALMAGGWSAPEGSLEAQHHCPACASPPVAALTVHERPCSGQRYLQCSLCSLQWQMLRGVCSHCGSTKVAYQSVQGLDQEASQGAVVQGESCDTCGHYLKLMVGERDAQVDAVADDLATVTLDLLMADAGLQRHGHNLLLLYGDAEPGES